MARQRRARAEDDEAARAGDARVELALGLEVADCYCDHGRRGLGARLEQRGVRLLLGLEAPLRHVLMIRRLAVRRQRVAYGRLVPARDGGVLGDQPAARVAHARYDERGHRAHAQLPRQLPRDVDVHLGERDEVCVLVGHGGEERRRTLARRAPRGVAVDQDEPARLLRHAREQLEPVLLALDVDRAAAEIGPRQTGSPHRKLFPGPAQRQEEGAERPVEVVHANIARKGALLCRTRVELPYDDYVNMNSSSGLRRAEPASRRSIDYYSVCTAVQLSLVYLWWGELFADQNIRMQTNSCRA